MSDQLILQLITTITIFCTDHGVRVDYKGYCFQKIWNCGHKVKYSTGIVTETHNCITDYTNGKLK